MAVTRVHVTDNLSLMVYKGGVEIHNQPRPDVVWVEDEDIPALLARLTEAAAAMGVETAMNNALVVAKTRATWLESVIRMARTQLESGNPSYALDTLGQAVQALAKAGQQ